MRAEARTRARRIPPRLAQVEAFLLGGARGFLEVAVGWGVSVPRVGPFSYSGASGRAFLLGSAGASGRFEESWKQSEPCPTLC